MAAAEEARSIRSVRCTLLSRAGVVAITVAVLGPLTLGTEPTPPPYHEYEVHGQIIRPSGGSLANFVVTLVGRFSIVGVDSTTEIGEGFAHPGTASWGVSDTSGMFWMNPRSPIPADSLVLKVSVPDHAPVYGVYFQVPENPETITTDVVSTSSSCGGCGTVEPMSSRTEGYRYRITGLTVVVPY